MNTKINLFIRIVTFVILLCVAGTALAVEFNILEKRAEFTLGLDKEDFSISNIEKSGVRTDFVVTVNSGEIYRCYVASGSGVVSDAVCSQRRRQGKSNPKNSPACNALLKAAGKC